MAELALRRRVNALAITLGWAGAACTIGAVLDLAVLSLLGWFTVTLGLSGWVVTEPAVSPR
jgi:hypothetical protein